MKHPLPPSWLELEAHVNGRTTFGEKGIRDPDAPCEYFDPTPNIDWLGLSVTAPGNGNCYSDGHYLCLGCLNLEIENDRPEE